MEYILREFQDDDLEALWRIDQACFAPGIAYSRGELTAYVNGHGVFTLVAVDASEADPLDPARGNPQSSVGSGIRGFIVAQGNRRRVGHIITIDVLPEQRRSGVGSSLMDAAEKRLRSVHCDRVRLEAAVDNDAAIRFYKRHGYDVTKTIAGYYSNGTDAFILTKML